MVPDALTGGPYFAAFCERYIVHTKGRWARKPLILEPWQREFWWEALEVDPSTGLRVYTEVGLGIPRKNGKSTNGSSVSHYFLVADGEAEPEVYIGAAARHQAGVVFGQSRRMALQSPRLLQLVHPQKHAIECPSNGGIMRAVSADAGLQHGLNPSANIIDELQAHKDGGALYTALTTGEGAREQPFTLWISTAGEEGSFLAEFYASMFSGQGELERRGSLLIYRDRDNGVLIYWYGAPREADIEDPSVWLACNPASWLQDGRSLARAFGRLKDRGDLLSWRRYYLNQFVGSDAPWLPDGAWAACTDGTVDLMPDLPLGVGVYKAPRGDAAAIVVAQRQGERFVVRARTFLPNATGSVSTEEMRNHLRELMARFPRAQAGDPKTKRPVLGPAVAYSKWQFAESAETLDQEGLHMVDYPLTAATMGPASTFAYELAGTLRLAHADDRVLAEHVADTQAVLTDQGMKVVPRGVDSTRRNHAAIAMVLALAMARQDPPAPRQPSTFRSF